MKKLKKGFTLVELIVVMAIMGIIMAIIMAIIAPTSRVATKIEYRANAEQTGIQISRNIKNVLSFATNVAVIAADDGDVMPVPPAEYGSYNNVYIFDNTVTRAQSAKGAHGQVRVGTWNAASKSITDDVDVIQTPMYFENDFDFCIDEYNSNRGDANNRGNAYINLSITGHPMVVDSTGNGYEPDTKQNFEFKDCIEFCNINNWGFLTTGGNDTANKYMIYIDQESLMTKKDKIYIFFTAAADTPITTGTGILTTSPEEDPGSSSTTTPTVTYAAVFKYSSTGTAPYTCQVADGAVATPINDITTGSIYEGTYDGYRYKFDGWYELTSNEKLTASGPKAHNTQTFEARYVKVDTVKVHFQDYNGNELCYYTIDKGDMCPSVEGPEAPDGYMFDKWETVGSGKAYGEALTEDTTYKAVSKEVTDMTTFKIHFLNEISNSVVYYSNKAWFNNNELKTSQPIGSSAVIAEGTDMTIRVQDGGCLKGEFMGFASGRVTLDISGSQLDHSTHDYYIYYDPTGALQLSTTNGKKMTNVTIVFVDDDCVEKMTAKGPSSGVNGIVKDASANTLLVDGTYATTIISGSCTGTKKVTFCTNGWLYAGNNSSNGYKVTANGVDKTVYVYNTLSGVEVSETMPDRNALITVHFEEAGTGVYMRLRNAPGKLQLMGSQGSPTDYPYSNTGYWVSWCGNNCPEGAVHQIKIWQNTYFADEVNSDKGMTVSCLKDSDIYFYEGTFHKNSKSGPAASLCDASIEMQGNWGVRVILKNNTGSDLTGSHKIILTTASNVSNSGAAGDKWGSLTYDNASVGNITAKDNTIEIEFNLNSFANGTEKDFYFKPTMTGTYNVTDVTVS